MVELGILVEAEALVVAPHLLEGVHPHQRVVAVIDRAAALARTVGGATGSDSRVLRRGHGALKRCMTHSGHGHHNAAHLPLLGLGDKLAAIIEWILTMRVDADEVVDARTELSNCHVDGGTLD